MITSMTGFARTTQAYEWGTITWELKSINHRFMELSIKLPEVFRDLEASLREQVNQSLKRGKIDCYLKYQAKAGTSLQLEVNEDLVKQLAHAVSKIHQYSHHLAPATVGEILAWPGVLQTAELDTDSILKDTLELFAHTLQALGETRQREGEALQKFMEERLQSIDENVLKVKTKIPMVLASQHNKLITRVAELNQALNHERLEQEWLLLAQKMDVTEEMDRLATHVAAVRDLLKKGGMLGRQLDFLMQELNREANTMAAKSIDAEVTHIAVELKVLIEQMREQIQNIE